MDEKGKLETVDPIKKKQFIRIDKYWASISTSFSIFMAS